MALRVRLPEAAAGRQVLQEGTDAFFALAYGVEADGVELLYAAGLKSARQVLTVDG
jgi:hypothetical protein